MKTNYCTPLILGATLMVLAPHMAFSQKSKQSIKEPEPVLELWQVDTLINPIPLNRSMFTDNIMKQVAEADRKDGAMDQVIETDDSTVSRIVTEAMLQRVPLIMTHIENMNLSHQQKIYYHKALGNLTRRLNKKPLQPENALYIRKSVENFEELLLAREQNRVMEFVRANDNIYTLDNSELLDDYPEAKMLVFTSVGNAYPEMMIKRLPSFAMESYADPVIAAAAKVLPGTILTYAISTSALSTAVRRNKDPLVKSIVRIANESKAPLKALPFLEEVNSGRKTVAEIDAITADPKAYYEALVRLKMQGKSVSDRAIDQELEIRGLQFVRVVNELHDEPAPVRFKSLMDFSAEDLYFMMIGSQQEIYTSSFVWMCKRMMEKMKPASGDELLNRVHKSHFRTFIRMCAGYNMLADFLATIGEEQKTALMREFVANLHEGPFDSLEDAVDVADAFGSLADPALIAFLKEEVRKNYELKINAKGIIVYGLLSTIFNSAENAEALNEDVKDLIPPITFVPGSSLRNEDGAVIEHVFFYGDKDGMVAYANYIRNFNNNKWKVEQNEYWATITSTGPNKVIIYANRPLPEEEGLDEIAQKKLAAHLREQNITPTIIIHRGHSYFLPTTLEYLSPETKIVMLGSCGGYHNLSKVLNTAHDAHIISSKQVGALNVNMPIINAIDNQLLAGKDVNWIEMWAGLRKYFDGRGAVERDLFSDYIPPNKNLGAIFIKAYRKQAMILEGFQ